MKNTYNFARIIAVVVVMVVVVLVSLGIFGVFSSNEIKDALQKIIGVAAVVIAGSAVVSLITGRK